MLEKWNASLFLDVMAKIKAEAGGEIMQADLEVGLSTM